MTCKQNDCPKRNECAVAQKQVEGTITIFKGYVNDPKIPENKRCNFFIKITVCNTQTKEIEK